MKRPLRQSYFCGLKETSLMNQLQLGQFILAPEPPRNHPQTRFDIPTGPMSHPATSTPTATSPRSTEGKRVTGNTAAGTHLVTKKLKIEMYRCNMSTRFRSIRLMRLIWRNGPNQKCNAAHRRRNVSAQQEVCAPKDQGTQDKQQGRHDKANGNTTICGA